MPFTGWYGESLGAEVPIFPMFHLSYSLDTRLKHQRYKWRHFEGLQWTLEPLVLAQQDMVIQVPVQKGFEVCSSYWCH